MCKVADFGLSREVDIDTTDGAYTTKVSRGRDYKNIFHAQLS